MPVAATFRHFGAHIASSRYRAIVPQQFIAPSKDTLVIGKHGWDWDAETRGFRKVVFDVTDDHFGDQWAAHYIRCCDRANAVTCNSREMARIIREHTGRTAWVIPDPYLEPEKPARVHGRLLWFGHRSNLPDLGKVRDTIAEWPLEIVSNAEGCTAWSPDAMDAAFERAGLVVIPTGRSMAKSANRAIESIRRGLYPICGYLPAYADLGVWIGPIAEGVRWALNHQDTVIARIRAAQAYVATEYAPERIAGLWREVLETL